jgi:hypothetical protein
LLSGPSSTVSRERQPTVTEQRKFEGVMKGRITNDGRFLGLDFADWSMLIVGFTLAGLLSLYI